VFVRLVCRNGALTIGAPTSPAIANAICHELDSDLEAVASAEGVTYTRYADDLYFSTNRRDVLGSFPAKVRNILDELDRPATLKLNSAKTHHSSKKHRREVTGLVLTTDGGVSVGRSRKRKIRAMIHQYDGLSDPERDELAGLIGFVQGIEPDFVNTLILKYGKQAVDQARAMPSSADAD
jgi:RNA-directed DNA polymerase